MFEHTVLRSHVMMRNKFAQYFSSSLHMSLAGRSDVKSVSFDTGVLTQLGVWLFGRQVI